MKALLSLFVLGSILLSTQSFACSGCSTKKSGNVAANIQSAPGNAVQPSLSGARIIGSAGNSKPFKNEKVFESVGKDQGEIDPNWKSSISE